MADGSKPSIEETMAQTFDRIQADEKAERASAAAEVADTPEVPKTEGGDPSQAGTEGETAEQKADRLRAEDGKFRTATRAEKKAAKTAETKSTGAAPAVPPAVSAEAAKVAAAPTNPATAVAPDKAAPAAEQKPDQTSTGLAGVNPPAGWSAAAKAAFASLPPAVQAAVSRREQEVTQGFAQYEGIGKALQPVQQQLAMQGIPAQAYVNQMVQLDLALRNPATRMQAWDYLAKSYGINLNGQQQADTSTSAPQLSADPTIATLQQQLAAVTSHLNQQQNVQRAQIAHESEQTQRQANADVDAFRNDPANEFFDLVRGDVQAVYERAAVLHQKAPTLKEAYEQAVWANPQTRPVLLARQAQEAETKRVQAAADAAAKARKSGAGNLRGTPGATPASGPKRSVEEEMAEVYDRIHAA